MLNLINGILGASLLAAGRKLFWLFVGAAGFVLGLQLADRILQGRSDATAIIAALIFALIFVGLAVFLQKIAISLAGFFAGGYLLTVVAGLFDINGGVLFWLIYIAGGILGIVMIRYLFDWAIISISSLMGASLIVQAFGLQRVANGIVFLILVIAGVAIQGTALRREKRPSTRGD